MSKNNDSRMTECLGIVLRRVLVLGAVLFGQQVWAQAVEPASAPAALPDSVATGSPGRLPVAAPATAPPPTTWSVLSSAQQTALMPLQRDWDGMDAASRSKWVSIASRFSFLPAEDQLRMHERMRAWARSSPSERQQARVAFHAAQQMAAEQRQAKWEAYQALPPEKRQELAAKAAQKLTAKAQARRVVAIESPQPKSNLVPAALKGQPVKVVAPSILQARPGATTVFINQIKILPAHQQAGQTKVFADPDLVDRKTLLPKRRPAAPSP
jgi:hypothetical protein